jgi:hypothetical protein
MPGLTRCARAVAVAVGAPAGWLPGRRSPSAPRRPGRVADIRGIVLQSDARSLVGDLVIRPFELADRWIAGLGDVDRFETLANHAGIHLVMADGGGEVVVEQLVGSAHEDFVDGLNWTPIERFRARDRGGWDATVPTAAFRGVDARAVAETIARLNTIEGHPFVGEDCTQFVERAFGGRRLFADSPLLQRIGLGARVGDPALPLLRPGVRFEPRSEVLVRAEAARALPDPLADHGAPNVRLWLRRAIGLAAVGAVTALALTRARGRNRV